MTRNMAGSKRVQRRGGGKKPPEEIFIRHQDCPNCGQRVSMVPYDTGSGPEMACPTCESAWGADGQDLEPLDVPVLLPHAGGGSVEVRFPLLNQRRGDPA